MQINARAMTGAVISRLKHQEEISIPTAHTVLHEGDYIQAVGSEEALTQLAVLVGEREEGELPLENTQEIESLLLTKKDMTISVGRPEPDEEFRLYRDTCPSKRYRPLSVTRPGIEVWR